MKLREVEEGTKNVKKGVKKAEGKTKQKQGE